METKWFAASAVLALAVGLSGASAVSSCEAKPADLPSQNGIECPDGSDGPGQSKFQFELDITSKGITLKWGVEAMPATPPNLDALMPAFVEHWLAHLGDMIARPDRFISLDAILAQMSRVHTAYFGGANANRQLRAEKARATLETRLFEPVNVKIKDVPFQQAIKNLAHVSGIRIVPDYEELECAKVNLNHPVTLIVENTSVHIALQQLLNPARLTFEIEDGIVKITVPEKNQGRTRESRDALAKGELAQQLFEIAERHRRTGDLDRARKLFQQVHLVAPTTLHGRVAIVRIIELEERMRDASEEQGGQLPGRADDPEQVFRDMHERSIPLGLVNVSY